MNGHIQFGARRAYGRCDIRVDVGESSKDRDQITLMLPNHKT